MTHDGWCPDCDLQTVVIDADEQGENGWATCVECGAGWVHRDEIPETQSSRSERTERRAA